MRWLVFALVWAPVVLAACGGRGEPRDPTPSSETPTPQLSAREILRRSDEAMNRLRSARVRLEVRPTVAPDINPPRFVLQEFAAPNKVHYVERSEEGVLQQEIITIGDETWTRTGLRDWEKTTQSVPLVWPYYDRLKPRSTRTMGSFPVTDIRLLREERLGDQAVWVISYTRKEPSIEGPFDVFWTEWISRDSFLLLRREQRDNDPFGVQAVIAEEYSDFNTLIEIAPPSGGGP